MPKLDTIVIEGMRVQALIGVYPHEREQRQPLLVDLQLQRDFALAAQTDALAETIDYAEVVASLRAFIGERSDLLLERLAHDGVRWLVQRYQPAALRLHLRKPDAAAVLDCAAVGVCVEWRA